jgi:GNAT superfamily N-acetyltransferase
MYKFVHLGTKPELCEQIANVTFKEWAEFFIKLSGIKSPEQWKEGLEKKYVHKDILPSGYVVIDEHDNFIGFVCINVNEAFKQDPEQAQVKGQGQGLPKIWLSCLYVMPEHRKKGVAKKMVDSLSRLLIKKYRVPAIYLWIDSPLMHNFYQKLGFIAMDTKVIEGYNFTIYKKELIPPPPPLIEPVHIIGLFVLIVIILLIRRGFGIVFWILGIFQPKPIIVKIET